MGYREHRPAPLVARHVACTWTQVVGAAPIEHIVVPDACADILSVDGGAPFVVGPATATVIHRFAAGTTLTGVRFRPASIAAGLGVPPATVLDGEPDLADVWSEPTAALEEALARAPVEARAGVLEAAVQARFARGAHLDHVDRLAAHAVRWLAANPGQPVQALARAVGISERQLQRRIRAATGYGPKLLQRILRFQRALLAIEREPDPRSDRGLAWIAAAAGYADQAHLTREVHELAGLTPGEVRGRGLGTPAMSVFFKTIDDARPSLVA